MSGKDRGVVYDGAFRSSVDDVHWNKLGTEWHHVERGTYALVLFKHLGDELT